MHMTRKNISLVWLYRVQSFSLATFLLMIARGEDDRVLMVVALLTFVIKVIVAPYFLASVIKRSKVYFTSGAYVGIPLSLLVIVVLMFFSTKLITPFFSAVGAALLPVIFYPILFSGFLISLFFIVNRRDVLSEIIGILSLENWTVFTGVAIGVKHSLMLELGMSVNIAIWIIIALIFITRLHQSFGTLHVSHLTHLKED